MSEYYTRTRYRYVRDPQTGKMKPQAYTEKVQRNTATMFQELKNIQTAAASGKSTVRLKSPAAGGAKRTYTSTQLQTIKDIQAAKESGADVRQFRSPTNMGMTREQEALVGAIDRGTGYIRLGEVGEFAKREKQVQQSLQPIRERRQAAVQKERQSLLRRTGRRALLASAPGGAGFFGGYFKG